MSSDKQYDLIVVGCGAAGLSTAVSFAEASRAAGHEARIAVLERSSEAERGASTRWTNAGMRVDRDFVLDPRWIDEMQERSRGLADLDFCREFEREVPETGRFLHEHGVEFVHYEPGGIVGIHKAWAAPNGGGLAIIDHLADALAEHPGATVRYETEAVSLLVLDDGRVGGIRVRDSAGRMSVMRADAVMLACGGFEGNYEMLTRYLGKNAVDFRKLVPGTRFNTGDGIRMAQQIGAACAGQYDAAHTECIDARSTKPDAIIVGHNYCVVVNADAERFLDEGEHNLLDSLENVAFDIWEKAGNTAFFITDEAVIGDPRLTILFESDVPLAKADTIADLATQLGLDPEALERTVTEFNAACGDATYDPTRYDGKATEGLVPPKSNWANPIATAPFYGVPISAAICFTFGGLRTDASSRVLSTGGFPIPGLYAAGEIVGITYHEYPTFTNVLRACTYGRIAGAHMAAAGRTTPLAN